MNSPIKQVIQIQLNIWLFLTDFSEIGFDGTYLAAKLMARYQKEFSNASNMSSDELRLLLAFFAQDVMRTAEQEIKSIEAAIRKVCLS